MLNIALTSVARISAALITEALTSVAQTSVALTRSLYTVSNIVSVMISDMVSANPNSDKNGSNKRTLL
jgi:hypothetical protein